MTTTTDTITVPLNLLVQGKDNVRRTGKRLSIEELTASIRAHGLRQNLNVKATDDGRYEVVAGGRRLRALKELAKAKHLPKDHPVPCRVLTEDEDAGEISLAENVVRVAMHPADQFEAFHALVHEKGQSIAQVAERFGVETTLVEKRLKLASVHPKLIAAYRKEEINLDCLMAFAVTDDHEAQLRVWQEGRRGYLDPRSIRQALTEGSIPASHRLALFVGQDAYLAAGGTITRDLFDSKNQGYFADGALLMQLATDQLDAIVEQERAAGWKWVKAELENDYSTYYGRVHSFTPPWQDESDDETGECEPTGEEDETDQPETFTEEDMARSGVRIRIDHDGSLNIERGLIHPDDQSRATCAVAKAGKPDPAKGEYPATLMQDLTAHRTAALRMELASNPAVALAATVHAMALPLLYGTKTGSCLTLSADSTDLTRHRSDDCTAYVHLDDMADRWKQFLPESADDLMAWCLNAEQYHLLDLLAYLSALSLDAIQHRHGSTSDALTHADQLADTLSLDMREHWQGSADGFYGRISKAAMVKVISEARAPIGVSVSDLKKTEAARYVAKAVAQTGWLPVPLRSRVEPPALAEAA